MLTILMGLCVGLVLGTGSAVVVERLNTSIKHQEELEKLIHIRGLAVIPKIAPDRAHSNHVRFAPLPWERLRGEDRRRGESVELVAQGATPEAEAYRALRTSLSLSRSVDAPRVLVVTSATPREGKTTTAANLALVYAQQGANVLLIDADLRRARQHKLFGCAASPGLTEVLTGEVAPVEAVRVISQRGLSILPAGTAAANPADLLGGVRMKQFLAASIDRYDLIVIDTPPILAVADATILSTMADGVLVVVHAGRTDREAVQVATQRLITVGARVIGAVLNDPDGKVPQYAPYSSYGYYYNSVG